MFMRKKIILFLSIVLAVCSFQNLSALEVDTADIGIRTKNMHQYIDYLICNQFIVEKCDACFVTKKGIQFSFDETFGWRMITGKKIIDGNNSSFYGASLSSFMMTKKKCNLSGKLKNGKRTGNSVPVSAVYFPMSSDLGYDTVDGKLFLEFTSKEKKYVLEVSLKNCFYDSEFSFFDRYDNPEKLMKAFFESYSNEKLLRELYDYRSEFERILYESISLLDYENRKSKKNTVPYIKLSKYIVQFFRNCFDDIPDCYVSRIDENFFKVSDQEGESLSNVALNYLYFPYFEKIGYEKYGFNSVKIMEKRYRENQSVKSGVDPSGFLSAVIACSKIGENPKSESLRRFYDDYVYFRKNENSFSKRKMDYKENVYSKKEMENTTCIVPSLEDLQKGDFLISEDLSADYSTAVIIDFIGGKKDLQSVVVVVSPCNDGEFLRRTTWAELEKQQPYYPRRFLKYDSSKKRNVNKKNDDFIKNMFLDEFKETFVVYDFIYEENQIVDNKTKWNFIPNTGEFLFLHYPKIISRKKRMPVYFSCDGLFCVENIGLVDLKSEDFKYSKNTPSSAFEVKLRMENDVILDYGNYYCFESEEYRSQKKFNSQIFIDLYSGRLYVSMNGKDLFIKDLMIRPIVPSVSVPGDDLLFTFYIRNSSDSKSETRVVYSDENYSISVYDKKIVWRANLFLNERIDSADWNILHPWNSEDNEWNKICSSSSNHAINTVLEKGDGTQVVSFCEYTPLRTTGKNIVNTVPYDYNSSINVNAWDSPFDFMFKMTKQKNALRNHFYEKYSPYVDFKKSGGDIEKQPDEFKEKYAELEEPGIFPKDKEENISGNSITNYSLSQWNNTFAPNSRWKFYWKDGDLETDFPYVPGAGFFMYLKDPKSKLSVETCTNESSDLLKKLVFPKLLSAGTDCIGFVYRSCSYSGNAYQLFSGKNFSKDRAEGNPDPDEKKRSVLGNGLCYPLANNTAFVVADCSMLYGTLRISNLLPDFFVSEPNDSFAEDSPDSKYFEDAKKMLLRVIPGDIISYGDQLSKNEFVTVDRCAHCHIGMVDYVDRDKIKAARNYHELFSAIRIIESVFSSSCNYVLKRKMSEDGLSDSRSSNWYIKNNVARPWAIHRLKSVYGQY